ncbi:MAG: hypothetical protein K8F30_09380 [Taibaiella sp.]|nr:hypothetical protein [Taibaiella sp.]
MMNFKRQSTSARKNKWNPLELQFAQDAETQAQLEDLARLQMAVRELGEVPTKPQQRDKPRRFGLF